MTGIPVGPASITPAWLSEVLGAEVRSCEVEQIAVGVGLLGRLYRVHIDGGPDAPSTVIVKLPTLDQTARTNLCEDLEFYLREVRFYDEIGDANPLRPAHPYFTAFDEVTHDFVLVLEDLGRLRLADQLAGCTATDAETVIDALARHHAYWWNNRRLASLHWLKPYNEPRFAGAIIDNFKAAWPCFLERLGGVLSPEMRDYGERFASMMPRFLDELARPPVTFLHGDLRLDQLFFGVNAGDPSVKALDWQVTARGRGAYDVSYFLSQSLAAETRRAHQDQLLERYAGRLAEHGIVYPRIELQRDYGLTTAWCFIYPVMAAGRIKVVNDRNMELVRAMLNRAVVAIEDQDVLALGPD